MIQQPDEVESPVGVWPLPVNDVTVIEECEPRERLVLLDKGRRRCVNRGGSRLLMS
ncbi:hypothetical protein H7J08_27645 [Mycobacterium frederiksbergense]|uniref:hypothetical protein n=1 Tax=Mycolicibacterium frederiksbergense TaxID=117567 RepID=UPI0021F2A002|nr:hypothetical protein [Mycolicibacterium frederiksbergense]MCV7048402.1 hypothetical protein [Mycolicibacterium frederiksbergense]